MQQNPSLPYDPLTATSQFMQIDVNNPPFVPNYQCEPQIQQYGPYCAGLLMIELQSAAARNPLRMFAFNMYAKQVYPGQPNLGEVNVERLSKLQDFYLAKGLIQKKTPVEELYSNAFIK